MKRKRISREDLLENLRQAELTEAIARREIESVVRGCIGQLKSGAGSLHRSLDSLAEVEAAIRVAGAALDGAREFGISEWRQALDARERARRDWERAVR